MRFWIPIIAVTLVLQSCLLNGNSEKMEQQQRAFDQTIDRKKVALYTLTNANGLQVQITSYGATIVSIQVPDKQGKMDDIVAGYDSLGGYINGKSYFGCVAGRYANRIAQGKFDLDGKTYTLAINNGPNALHGGIRGFGQVVWDAQQDSEGLTLQYNSRDGEEGYPGNLIVKVRYTLSNDNTLAIHYHAETDKATVLNLTNHSYFNLEPDAENMLDHELQLNAAAFTPVDSTLIPTGELRKVAGTPFDFTQPQAIGARINDTTDAQIKFGGGYDHNFVLNGPEGELKFAARVTAPRSGRIMEVYTTEPGIQFYSGNFLNGSESGKGKVYGYRAAFCLETQHFPNSPNQPEFPSTVLQPGKVFESQTQFRFLTK